MKRCHVAPVDPAAPPADHSDWGIELGSRQRRSRAYAHRQGVGGLQTQDQRRGLTWTNPCAASQRVLISVGMRVIVEAKDQVDRLGRRVVDRDRQRLRTRPIGGLFGRPNDQLRPIGELEIDPRGDAAGIDPGSRDPGKAGSGRRDAHGICRIAKVDDRRHPRLRPPGRQYHAKSHAEDDGQLPDHCGPVSTPNITINVRIDLNPACKFSPAG